MPAFGTPTGWGETLWDALKRGAGTFGPASAEAVVLPQDPQAQALVDAVKTGQTMPPGRETNPLVTGAFDPQRKEMYRRVYEAAQVHPADFPVRYSAEDLAPSQAAVYRNFEDAQIPGGEIQLRPTRLQTAAGTYPQTPPTAISEQDSLAHELLHGLQHQYFRDWQPRQQRPVFPELAAWQRFLGGGPQDVDVREAFRAGRPQLNNPQHRVIQYLLGGQEAPASLQAYTEQVPLDRAKRPDTNEASRLLYNAFFRQLFPEGPLREKALLPTR